MEPSCSSRATNDGHHGVHWLAHGERELPATFEWLSSREHALLDTIRFRKRRSEYLTRRWTAKHAVVAVLGLEDDPVSLAAVEIRNRESGAPYVEVDGRAVPVDVSLSDRAGWAVCLVGSGGSGAAGSIGVDLELVEPRSDGFVDDFFTSTERAYVRSLPVGESRDEAANLIWSAKEAALKVQQVGLRVDTRSVEVVLDRQRRPDGWAAMFVDARGNGGGRMSGWWRRDGVFLSTIAFASGSESEPPRLLPGGAHLANAEPTHSWLERPVV
ncbi:MAG: 4'-phosphopantetheinyl transferase superfamily protein [Acidimicrobiia bacterium]